MAVRKACEADVSRIAEIRVFVNRTSFYPIFGDIGYSFGEMQVLPVAAEYAREEVLQNIWVYDDEGTVKGFLHMSGSEVKTLYVDPFFQNCGVGAALLEFAKEHFAADNLWALEKNTAAIRFYARHGFYPSGLREFEEGTTEYLVQLVLQKQ
ncbi:MAG: GNAT family N-acetyltransferase [Oscillospiraceae bacterium]|nr:GNAT family N-acetyltransferase [Oscillospiraceae bacterium]